jgi:hypothetical protein
MELPDLDALRQSLIHAKREDQTWGELFAEIRRAGHIESDSAEHRSLIESGLIELISDPSFYSSPNIDYAAKKLGVKSWQVTEYVEGIRELLSIGESDFTIIEEELNPTPKELIEEFSTSAKNGVKVPHVLVPESKPQSKDTMNGAPMILVIATSFLTGALAILIMLLIGQRNTQHISSPTPIKGEQDKPIGSPQTQLSARPNANTYKSDEQWDACRLEVMRSAPPPQTGEVWWPVNGPLESLASARKFCRPDAYKNKSGNVQVASFREKQTAEQFAQDLTSDSSHPYQFWVGDPSNH